MSQLQSNPHPPLHPQSVKRHQACTSCRQVKLRCDNAQTFPAACTRCRKNNLQCRVDPNFRRIRTKHRLSEVTQELTALQKKLAEKSNDDSQQGTSTRGEDSTQLGENGQTAFNENFYFMSPLQDLPEPTPYLGDIELEADQVVRLFEHFHKHYYRHCPILNTQSSVAALYNRSPFLFWTIIIISSRHHPTLGFLYDVLTEPYRSLLEKTMMAPLNALEPIQGGVLLCVWPLNVRKQIYDPSWNYCGLVTNAAIRMGLHRSGGYRRDNISPLESRAQSKTWMACCFLNYSHLWQTGVCLLPEVPNMLNNISAPHAKMEKEFLIKNSILKLYAKTTTVLGNLNENVDCAFLQYLCRDLDNLREANKEIWNSEAEIILLGAQLCIYTQHLERTSRRDGSAQRKVLISENDSSTDVLANIVFGIASRLITTFTSPESEIRPYVPKHYFQLLLLASTLILKLSVVYPVVIGPVEVLVQNLIAQAYQNLDSWSVREGDDFYRAARLIEALAQAQKKHQLKMKEARNALGSGITVLRDAIVTHRALRGEDEDEGMLQRQAVHVRDFGQNGRDGIPISPHEHLVDRPRYPDGTDYVDTNSWEPRVQDAFTDWNLPWGWDPVWSQDFGINMDASMFL
ncbi:hypothetical protein ONS95_006145 [Cadophora gregata]|uniref:uncharacterized protein n=1 Tax=Cadophora gregata TaxID=51156 RepID=UPI0026DB41F4|nr:uncharacterized protein ONS95_006145 [Cadophora gregata]KAK0102532.1 hypothetical protein ONS95_006145 [Cadophora gregata]KAK0104158.1 hypothetical protein ONS96_005252 [Cadophora gregata f. sp. sojae]